MHTKAWYGSVVKGLGGIGIDRSQKNDLVNFVAKQFEKRFQSGHHSGRNKKLGSEMEKRFYHMALAAKVPIVLAAGDFKRKIIYLGYTIPTKELHRFLLQKLCRKFRITM
jgi:hypothetical protein